MSGSYLQSCFGSAIEDLVRIYSHVREVKTAPLIDLVWRIVGISSFLVFS